MTLHAHTARQGHRYAMGDRHVLAMDSGQVVTVRPIDHAEPYPLGAAVTVKASWLKPLPMVYFKNEVPS
jgi:hypothetical protein